VVEAYGWRLLSRRASKKPALSHQRLDARVSPAEGSIRIRRLDRVWSQLERDVVGDRRELDGPVKFVKF
jgi:hypothetical protein